MKVQHAERISRQGRSDAGTTGQRKTYVNKGRRVVEVNRQDRRNQEKLDKPFVAWDGEGYNDATGHHYSLFGSSLGARVEKPSLTWRDCIRLLLESPKEAYHAIYAGTYDVVMMFRDTPIIAALLKGDPVKYQGYRLLYRKSKYLQVTDLSRKGQPDATRVLYDVFTFFRVSFVAACREYGVGDPDILADVESMKLKRNDFTGIDQQVRDYMSTELDLLVMLCDNLRDRLALANIYPAQWHGPGAIASAALRTHKISQCRGSYPVEFRHAAEAAYYGGRFEQFQRGTHLGHVYQYDIRSAYPAAMAELPNLANVTWTYYNRQVSTDWHSDYALYRVVIGHIPGDTNIGSLPHRNRHGTILFPSWAYGWYWGIECAHVPMRYRQECWYPTGPGLKERPFAFVQEDYRQRAILKAAHQVQEKALKLKLNSLYGKLAQSKGAKKDKEGNWRYPPFHEVVWAGWITAYTRRKLADAMHSVHHTAVIACETDSVFSTEPLDLDIGDGLGQWELQIADGIRYIQSGVSLILKGGEWQFKTRGFTVHKSVREVEIWERFLSGADATIGIRQTRFGTDPRIRDQFGKWYTMDRQLSLAGTPLEKRIHVECSKCRQGLSLGEALHPMTIVSTVKGPSVPYQFVWRADRPSTMLADLFSYEDDPILDTEYL